MGPSVSEGARGWPFRSKYLAISCKDESPLNVSGRVPARRRPREVRLASTAAERPAAPTIFLPPLPPLHGPRSIHRFLQPVPSSTSRPPRAQRRCGWSRGSRPRRAAPPNVAGCPHTPCPSTNSPPDTTPHRFCRGFPGVPAVGCSSLVRSLPLYPPSRYGAAAGPGGRHPRPARGSPTGVCRCRRGVAGHGGALLLRRRAAVGARRRAGGRSRRRP